jgi:site-specific DNA recombinase
MEKAEFEARVVRARERMSQVQAESQVGEERQTAEQELRPVIGQLDGYAHWVSEGLREADWLTRREVIPALVKRVEIDQTEVRLVFNVHPYPFDEGPEPCLFQDRVRRSTATASR